MMIYATILIIPQKIHVGVQENFNEWKEQIEDEPDVNHLDIGGFRKVIGHADEHGGEHQHAGEVHCHHGFKEKIFKKVCTVTNQIHEYCWKISG